LAQRFCLEKPQRTIERIAELDFIQTDPAAGVIDAVAQCFDFCAKAGLAFL
jgi:hypothetical protein